MSDFHFSQGSPGSAPEAVTAREKELLVALQAVTGLLDTFGSMLHPTPWERHGAERKIAAARLLLSGTNTPATADAGGLPVDLIADFRDAIAIAKHRAEHAGDTARKKRWIEVRGRLDAYVQADRAPAADAVALHWPHGATEAACSSCGLTMGESRLLADLKRGEMVAVPADRAPATSAAGQKPDGYVYTYQLASLKEPSASGVGMTIYNGIRDVRGMTPIFAGAPADINESGLEALMAEHRIAVTPEYEGGFHAQVYCNREEPLANGYGPTPSAAVADALKNRAAAKGAAPLSGGEA